MRPSRFRAGAVAICERLLCVAGDLPRHILMQADGPRKYVERPNEKYPDSAPVTEHLIRRHLEGSITLGAYLLHTNGLTWAVCWDADNEARWEALLRAGRELLASGAKPIIERSPTKEEHAGGGHLWIILTRPADPRAARATAEKHAPELRDFREFWPGCGGVRLLGGHYRYGETNAWCEAAAMRRSEERLAGVDAAGLALTEETPSDWVTEPAPPVSGHERPDHTPLARLDTHLVTKPPSPEPDAWHDPEWMRRYGRDRHKLPWAISVRRAIEWYNWLHDVRSILPKEGNGYARATWRGERTPSVGYRPNNRWMDYGGNARDGQKGGDSFEAFVLKYHNRNRGRALVEVVSEMTTSAESQLQRAAREGRGVPRWVAEIMGPASWARYERLRASERGDSASTLDRL